MSRRFVQTEEVQQVLSNHINHLAMRFRESLHHYNQKAKATWYVWCLGEGSILGGLEFWPCGDPNEEPISATIDLRPGVGSMRYIAKIVGPTSSTVETILDEKIPIDASESEVSAVDRLTVDIRGVLLARLEAIARSSERG